MKETVTLDTIKKGSRVYIVDIPEGRGRTQLVRLGILKGEFIRCIERLPGGTIVIEKNRREIALGAPLARKILVVYAHVAHQKGRLSLS